LRTPPARICSEWEHARAAGESNASEYMEVPGLFELEGRNYVIFLDHGWVACESIHLADPILLAPTTSWRAQQTVRSSGPTILS